MKIEDGRYMTTSKWGFSPRHVTIKNGVVQVDGSDDKFNAKFFFDVNNIIKKIDDGENGGQKK